MDISEQLKKKKDEEASQLWIGKDPPARQCKKCMWAAEDTEYTVVGFCDVYEMPEGKPMDVLWDEVECGFLVEK